MAKELKIWNGRSCIWEAKLPEELRGHRSYHMYIAAYSVADASRLINEFNGYERNYAQEIKIYFSKGCWGNSMEGITPERGIWISHDDMDIAKQTPVRII
jgi:hypothetical protein